MINGFNEWAATERLVQTYATEQLSGRHLGIDAEEYIQKLLTDESTKEPLLSALGGIPFSFEQQLEARITAFKEAKVKPYFVFHGLVPTASQQRKLNIAKQQSRRIDEAWDLYNASNADRAVQSFGSTCDFDVDHLYRYTQAILNRLGVDYFVAPYSAHAQLAYFEKDHVVDAVLGSSEILLYDCGRIILDVDLKQKQFRSVSRQACIDSLAFGNERLWIDSCLLAGCSLLEQLPQLEADRSPKIRAAAELMKRMQLDGNSVCLQYRDDPYLAEINYLENYRSAYMLIKHHVIMNWDCDVVTLHKEEAPNDIHAFIGQRLPDEIYHYVSRGTIGTRILAWRTSGHVLDMPPIDGGVSLTYETLVRDKIAPQRVKAFALLSQSLHRFYQHRDVSYASFFNSSEPRNLGVADAGNVKAAVAGWRFSSKQIQGLSKLQGSNSSLVAAFDIIAAPNAIKAFAEKPANTPLKTPVEIKLNTLWRYLQLQSYITPTRELSPLGKALQKAYSSAASSGLDAAEFEEPLLTGVELLRLNILTKDNLFPIPPYAGQPHRGTELDQKNTLLVSRVASLGRLAHKAIGYTGPLSRNLLAYKSLVSVVQRTQRDLLDMSLCTMFMDGHADRQIDDKDLKEVGLTLPFLKDNDCALALAVKHYLDELAGSTDPTTPANRDALKDKGQATWFPHVVDFRASLAYAFKLWDTMLVAVQALPNDVVSEASKKDWVSVDEWLKDRR